MLSTTEIQERIATFPEQCRTAGLKVTHQRVAIFNFLAGSESHPTPEEVYAEIRTEVPSISLATVYKVLDQFHRHGFLRRVSTEGQVARYDARLEHHIHLICGRCGRIRDLAHSPGAHPPPLPDVADFRIERNDILFHGRCKGCEEDSPALPA